MSLNNLTSYNPLTINGLDGLFIDGNPFDPNNYVSKIDPTIQTISGSLDAGLNKIKSSSSPTDNDDLINKLYIDTNFLNKTTATAQTITAASTFNSSVTANYFYTDNSYNWGRPSSSYNAWAIGRIAGTAGIIKDLQFKDDTANQTTLLLSSTGQTVYVGLTCDYGTANKVPIWDASKKLVSSGTDSSKIAFLDNVSSDIQTQINSKANASALASYALIAGNNIFTGSNRFSDNIKLDSGLLFMYGDAIKWQLEKDFSTSNLTWTQNESSTQVMKLNFANNNINFPYTTASRVAVLDSNKALVSSTVTTTTLGFLDATSSVQTQLNGKLNLTGGTLSGALTVDAGVSIGTRLLGTPDGVSSGNWWLGLQGTGTELERLAISITGATTTGIVSGVTVSKPLYLTATGIVENRAVFLDGDKILQSSAVTSTELGYVSGATSGLQGQIDTKASTSYVNSQVGFCLLKTGGTMTGTLTMGGNKVTSTSDPMFPDDLSRKAYVDTKLSLSGGTMTGDIGGTSFNIMRTGRYADYRAGMTPSQQPVSSMGFNFGTFNNNNTGTYADLLCLNSWSDSSAGNVNLLAFNKNGKGIRQYQGAVGSGSAFSTYYDCVMTDANSTNVFIAGDLSTFRSLFFGGSGTYGPGCIYSDVSWGCIIRAKTAGATARFLWSDVNDIYQMRISSSGVLNFNGGATASAVPAGNSTRAGSLVIGGVDTNYTDGWNTGLLMECSDTTGISVHDDGVKLASFMYYSGDRFYMGKDAGSGWGVTPITIDSVLTCSNSVNIGNRTTVAGGDNAKILYGPNSTWGAYLVVGAGTSEVTSDKAQVISTNGNLHLDAGLGRDIYIGYYPYAAGQLNTIRSYGTWNHTGNAFLLQSAGVGTTSTSITYDPPTVSRTLNVDGYINGLYLYSGGTIGTGSYYGYIQWVNNGHWIGNVQRAGGGHIFTFNSGGYNFGGLAAGTVAIDGAGYLYTYSDSRVKNTIEYFDEGSLDKVLRLKPCSFKLNQDPYNVKIGFIAQDVEEVIPDAVDGKKHEWQFEINKETGEAVIGDDGQLKYKIDEITGEKIPRYRGLDTTAILAHTVKAVQELSKTIDVLTLSKQEQHTMIETLSHRSALLSLSLKTIEERNQVLEDHARKLEIAFLKEKKLSEQRFEKLTNLFLTLSR
jgi:hypothetical protein